MVHDSDHTSLIVADIFAGLHVTTDVACLLAGGKPSGKCGGSMHHIQSCGVIQLWNHVFSKSRSFCTGELIVQDKATALKIQGVCFLDTAITSSAEHLGLQDLGKRKGIEGLYHEGF